MDYIFYVWNKKNLTCSKLQQHLLLLLKKLENQSATYTPSPQPSTSWTPHWSGLLSGDRLKVCIMRAFRANHTSCFESSFSRDRGQKQVYHLYKGLLLSQYGSREYEFVRDMTSLFWVIAVIKDNIFYFYQFHMHQWALNISFQNLHLVGRLVF